MENQVENKVEETVEKPVEKQAEKPKKPPTEVVFKHKEHLQLDAFIEMLETITAKLRKDREFIFVQGDKSNTVKPSDQVKVEIEYETKGDKHSFEIELEWYTGESAAKSVRIE